MRPREPDAPSVAGESDSSLDSRRSKVSVGDVMSVHMTPPSAPLLSPSTLMLPRETQIHTYHHLSAPIPLGSSAAKGRGAELVGILLIIEENSAESKIFLELFPAVTIIIPKKPPL